MYLVTLYGAVKCSQLHCTSGYIIRFYTVLFGDLRMFLAVIFSIKNEIYRLYLVIYGYVRSYMVSVGYVRSYTIIEGACPRSATHFATK